MPQKSNGCPHGWQLKMVKKFSDAWCQAQGPNLLEPTIAKANFLFVLTRILLNLAINI